MFEFVVKVEVNFRKHTTGMNSAIGLCHEASPEHSPNIGCHSQHKLSYRFDIKL